MTAEPSTIRLLVVGGSGFIGRHIIRRAIALGWAVTSLSLRRCTDGGREVRCLHADLTDRVALADALRGIEFEYVVNCGGYIDHTAFFRGGRRALESHFEAVLNVVEALERRSLRAFVNIGSSDEYGTNPAPQVETQRESPIAPYSAAKVAATHFLQMLHRTEDFPATTLRLFLTYGPGQDARRLLPQVILGCLRNCSFPVSAGEQLRDFCHVEDVVSAVFAALGSQAARGEVINIASGRPVSIRTVIEMVRSLVGAGDPQFGGIAYRRGENMELYASIGKARQLLGWEPAIGLEAGLAGTIDAFRSAP